MIGDRVLDAEFAKPPVGQIDLDLGANAEAFQSSSRERKKIEMRFAHMKRIFKLDRLRLRGLNGARDEVLLTATAQNLRRRLVKLVCRPHHRCELPAQRRRRCVAPPQWERGPRPKKHRSTRPRKKTEFCNRILR
jgi:hypothetical protein